MSTLVNIDIFLIDSGSFSKRWASVTTTTPMITSPITQDEDKYNFSDGVLSNEPTSKTFQTTSLTDATHQVPVEVTMLPVATPAPLRQQTSANLNILVVMR